MKGKILLGTLAAALCCAAMSGCMPLETNVENLMQPPTLTELQMQVDGALREAVGDSFILKYPVSGDYRSGFNFLDVDSDGTDEAIAFISSPSDESLRIALLRQTEVGWNVSDLIPGQPFFTEVDFVAVQQIGSLPRLLVGLSSPGRENSLLTLYSYGAGGQQTALTLDSRWDYARTSVVDMNRDGANELLLLVAADSYEIDDPVARLIGESEPGFIDLLAETLLTRNMVAFYPPLPGYMGGGQYGVTVDCLLGNGKLCTITISYLDGQLRLPLNEQEEQTIYRSTIRSQRVLSCDINGDGVVDIPIQHLAEGYTENDDDAVWFTDYCNAFSGGLQVVQRVYVDLTRGYRLLMPGEWSEHPVSAVLLPDNNEVVFFINSAGNLYDHSKELLRIRVYSALDGQDKLAPDRYFQLATRGSYVYAAALPVNPIEGLRLTKSVVEKAFSLM